MRVALLSGGRSLERTVSLASGERVSEALSGLGHEVLPIDPGADLVTELTAARPDAAFIALHGSDGEDGTVQSILDLAGIPFTGPGISACRLCSDKALSKHLFERDGVPTPDWIPLSEAAIRDYGAAAGLPAAVERLGLPLVVKPASQGSSLGITVVTDPAHLASAVVSALSYGPTALLERWVEGRELAVSVIGGEALPAVEAIPTERPAYDFEARYEIGASRFEAPARLEATEAEVVRTTALEAWGALGCRGFARVDLLLGRDGPEVLEVNAVPGLTETSLLPQAAEAAGIGFDALVERILELALDPGAA